ncbi:MAG TPA: HD domain-containing phosphohydrolase [Longimicrobiaceae bacterium]|nr:HD domain-containing phosphohydrolase [Longimicrobiaceae bacterium]
MIALPGSGADLAPEVLARIEAGRAAEMEGRREESRGHYEAALHALRSPVQARLAATIIRWIGRTHRADGNFDAVVDCAEAALAISTLGDDAAGTAHALNLLGGASQQRGELEEAADLFRSAYHHAQGVGDYELIAMTQLNLGVVANIQGNLHAARERYAAALDGFRAIGNESNVPFVLNNLGMLYTDLGQWEAAERHYADAMEVCERTGNVSARISIEVNRAELALARDDFEGARQSCDAAFELIQRTGETRALGDLHKHYGILHRDTGELWRAENHLGRAAAIADERQDLLLAAETAREQAELFWRQQRNQDTLRALNRAYLWFTQLRARRELADIDGRMATLEAMFLEIVHRWGESIESADAYTQGHCMRVADYACALAEEAIRRRAATAGPEHPGSEGLREQTLLWFRMGALLHDVGKLDVPVAVLNKSGPLTAAERTIMERHPDAGVELLADIEFPWDIRPMVRHHHERWTGGGYPTGIAGAEIPLSARILCIADVFDALTSDRPYRRGYSPAQALGIMGGSMRDHFDPELLKTWVEICARLFPPAAPPAPAAVVAPVAAPARPPLATAV